MSKLTPVIDQSEITNLFDRNLVFIPLIDPSEIKLSITGVYLIEDTTATAISTAIGTAPHNGRFLFQVTGNYPNKGVIVGYSYRFFPNGTKQFGGAYIAIYEETLPTLTIYRVYKKEPHRTTRAYNDLRNKEDVK